MLEQNKVKERRTELGMTQEQLAQLVGIGRSTLAEIESGKHEPTVYVGIRIARALGWAVDELFETGK